MNKNILLFLALTGCLFKTPEQANYTPISEQSQPIIIIKDSIVYESDLSFHPQQQSNAVPTQTNITEKGKNNYIFYCFALVFCAIIATWLIKKHKRDQ